MKMDRLIGILSLLLQQDKVTAPDLAAQFEVSRRTIQRDIESLCRAGIPIATAQGAGGGISIMECYRVNRTVLTAPQRQRHPPLRPANRKAVRRDRRTGTRRNAPADRPFLVV